MSEPRSSVEVTQTRPRFASASTETSASRSVSRPSETQEAGREVLEVAGRGLRCRDLAVVEVDGDRRLARHRAGRSAAGDLHDLELHAAAHDARLVAGALARVEQVAGRVDVDERAQVRVDRAQRIGGDLDGLHAAEHRDGPTTPGREDLARGRQTRLDAVEREQRLEALLGDGHDRVGVVAQVPERANDLGREVRHVGGDGEHPLVGRLGKRGHEPAERTLVGDLVAQDAHVGGQTRLGERVGAVGDDDRVLADLADRVDDARDERAAVDVEQRLVDAHAQGPSASEHGCGQWESLLSCAVTMRPSPAVAQGSAAFCGECTVARPTSRQRTAVALKTASTCRAGRQPQSAECRPRHRRRERARRRIEHDVVGRATRAAARSTRRRKPVARRGQRQLGARRSNRHHVLGAHRKQHLGAGAASP